MKLKTHLTFIAFFVICNSSVAQEAQLITLNTIKDDKKINELINRYPDLINGKVLFKNNTESNAKMNYNRLNDQIVFIDKRDTVVFGNPETASEIMIGTDKFYFHNKGYVEKVTEYLTINLGINQKVKFVGSAKKDGFGSYSAISNSVNLNTQDAVGNKEKADENHTYKSITTYYLIDKNNTIVSATEKNISSASPQYKKEIKTFMSSNKTNFKKRADIEKLLEFTNSLK